MENDLEDILKMQMEISEQIQEIAANSHKYCAEDLEEIRRNAQKVVDEIEEIRKTQMDETSRDR